MKRKKFILTTLAAIPAAAFSKIKPLIPIRNDHGFKVASGEARFGIHYKMKGVTLNKEDLLRHIIWMMAISTFGMISQSMT